MLKTIIYFSIFLLNMTACEKIDVPKGTPACIKQQIKKIKEDPSTNPPSSVWQYDYLGEIVYYIPPVCCDIESQLYDDQCHLICHPDGGITGKGDGKCPDFFKLRKNEQLIWKDDRK